MTFSVMKPLPPIEWRIEDPALGGLSEQGLFEPVKAGASRIFARHGDVMSAVPVEVEPAEIAFLKIIPEKLSLVAGREAPLRVLGEDRFGNVVEAPGRLEPVGGGSRRDRPRRPSDGQETRAR